MKQNNRISSIEIMQKNAEKAESVLKILANKNRLMILCHLVKGEKSVSEIKGLVGLSGSALSQHLSRMRSLNLVNTDKRGLEVFYRIENPEIEAILSTLYLIYCK